MQPFFITFEIKTMPISCYNTQSVIEIIMALIMLLSIIAIFYRSLRNSKAQTTKIVNNTTITTTGKVGGIGARIIQFACVTLIIPAIIILGIEKILQGETIATLIGGLIGYVLSGISNYDKDKE